MNQSTKTSLMLHPGVTREGFEKAATEIGLVHHETRPGNGKRLAYEQVWTDPDQISAVTYVECPLSNLHYLVLRGAHIPHYGHEFAQRIAVFKRGELLAGAVEAIEHNEQVRAINRLAIGFVEYDPDAFAVLEAYATQAKNPILREAAVNSMGFCAWPEFRPLIERIATDDPAENVRRKAERLLPYIPATRD